MSQQSNLLTTGDLEINNSKEGDNRSNTYTTSKSMEPKNIIESFELQKGCNSVNDALTLSMKCRNIYSEISKTYHEIMMMTRNLDNLNLVKTALDKLNGLCINYSECHETYTATILDETKRREEDGKYSDRMVYMTKYKKQIDEWIQSTEQHLSDQLDRQSLLQKYSRKFVFQMW